MILIKEIEFIRVAVTLDEVQIKCQLFPEYGPHSNPPQNIHKKTFSKYVFDEEPCDFCKWVGMELPGYGDPRISD